MATSWPLILAGLLALVALWYALMAPSLRRQHGEPATSRGDQRTGREIKDDGPDRQALLGPDQTNVNPPESYVIHHEGKDQGLDIAAQALRELTRKLSPDAPGHTPVRAPIPGRTLVQEEELVKLTGQGHRPGPVDKHEPPGSGRQFDEDGNTGRRVATADTHLGAAAELTVPTLPAPFVGEKRRRYRKAHPASDRVGSQQDVDSRMIDVAMQLRRGPEPSRPVGDPVSESNPPPSRDS